MIISEQKGRIIGFRLDSDGLAFEVETYPYGGYRLPFNENSPKSLNFDEFRWKRVKITVEMEEDDEPGR